MAQPEAVVLVKNPDGSTEYATVAQLAERARSSVPRDQLEQYQKWQAAKAGDRNAMIELLGLGGPDPSSEPPIPAGIESDRVRALEQELREIRENVLPTVSQINELRDQSNWRGTITEHADRLPCLARAIQADPTAVNAVTHNMRMAEEELRRNGHSLSELDANQMRELRARVVVYTENEMSRFAKIYGGWNPQAPAPQSRPGTQVVDDQRRQGAEPQPQVRVINGQMFDQYGRQVIQSADGRLVPIAVDNHIPSPSVGGASPGVSTGAANERLTVDDMKARMRARLSASGVMQ